MTREEILNASPALLNNWIDACVMNDHEGYGKSDWSGDITAAWEVVEKVGSRKEWMLYRLGHTDEDGTLKYECIFLQVLSGFTAVAKAQTAPEAICKAALLAVMEGKE